jgi:hypothetical protein
VRGNDLIWPDLILTRGNPPPEVESHPCALVAALVGRPISLYTAGRCTSSKTTPLPDFSALAHQVDARDGNGHTALLWAASQGHEGIGRLLLAKGADPNAADAHQRTPLVSAAEAGHTRVCEILLDRDAAIDAQTAHGLTALTCAALNDHASVVELLLARGADPTQENHHGLTAWQVAQDPNVKAIFNEVRPVVCMYRVQMRGGAGGPRLS